MKISFRHIILAGSIMLSASLSFGENVPNDTITRTKNSKK